jgi:protein arginine N-methyltransferase 1
MRGIISDCVQWRPANLESHISSSQKEMLEDHKRTGAYYQAVMSNKRQFAGKVVLDVGTGSGILAIFAAKAGARKVYAVEATSIANSARKLIEHNKVRKGRESRGKEQ